MAGVKTKLRKIGYDRIFAFNFCPFTYASPLLVVFYLICFKVKNYAPKSQQNKYMAKFFLLYDRK
ncbi:hypothetical protein BpHYR1_043171 [Brachionus plicatilis]|uniref:Uncharacterized protein n=1 Tax=Brachionus plicatilis TaxID=10195 RepID=A0A3M7QHJ0_BRAPC|nr:hypothetical protein BpHYR1_043171 [Brachionus plicatilis]